MLLSLNILLDDKRAWTMSNANNKRQRWRNLTDAQATIIAAAIAILPAVVTGLVTGYVTCTGSVAKIKEEIGLDDRVRQRIVSSLPTQAGLRKSAYSDFGFGFSSPSGWTVEDYATRFGVADIDVVQRYTDQKGAIGVEFKFIPVQPNYVNDFEAEVRNQSDVWQRIDPNLAVSDTTIAGIPAKRFEFKQATGKRMGDVQFHWVRLVPEVKLQILCFTYTDEPDRDAYWQEARRIVDSVIIDQQVIDEKRKQ